MHSSPLAFGAYADGTPNALFDGLNRCVCSFPTDRTTDTRRGSPSTPETIKANAALFSAAPELLDAVKELQESLQYHAPERFDCDESKRFWFARMERIGELIAKAEGRA